MGATNKFNGKVNVVKNQITKEYDEQLVSKLRDFGRDYLKFWIPEENNVLSLLNLFFSIVQSDKRKIKVKISKDKLNKEAIHELETYINKFSLYKIQKENDRLVIQLQNINRNILEEILNNYFIDSKLEILETSRPISVNNEHILLSETSVFI